MQLPKGSYDRVVTESLERLMGGIGTDVADTVELSDVESAGRLADVLAIQLARILEDIEGSPVERLTTQMSLVNELLISIRTRFGSQEGAIDTVSSPPRALHSIRSPVSPRSTPPETGLAAPWLFTAGKGSPSLLSELLREASQCDEIDMLVSFITASGVRKLRDTLNAITAAGANGKARTRIRVITTTYIGATEIGALDELARLNGCEVRISHDGRRTRLHAKAWIFRRRTGFGSAYVGSANLSGAALMGGLEWTVKFTEAGQGILFQRARAHFDTLWEDREFRSYRPEDITERAAVIAALSRERGHSAGVDDISPSIFFDIQPKHYQQEMLDQLARERAHDRRRNLVVAATGTGKTVVAALDYRRETETLGHRPRLLFVAHRKEILQQALQTYRAVLRDNSFGELMTGGAESSGYSHVFASIDHVVQRNLLGALGADYWHTVVIDECHHLPARRLDEFARNIAPQILLGLTATPERADGQSLEMYFDARPDGSPAVELRLWDALDMQLLAPFEYFACDDDTDLSQVPWGRPAEERDALNALLASNQTRARIVIQEWQRLSGDARRSKAVVFCVSVEHAEFMTAQLNEAQLPALLVVGTTDPDVRRSAPQKLASGEVCAIVTVDLYNEGVDLPTADTLLMLRPTQSPVVFQQQIGRGLRLSPGKDSCLVLDFVGQHRADFRFDRLLSGITGLTRRGLIEGLERGFSSLAPGCHIHLQQRARTQILQSLRALTHQSWRRLQSELRAYVTLSSRAQLRLADFLHHQQVQLSEVYRESTPSGWTSLQRAAGLLPGEAAPEEAKLSARFSDLLHVNDPEQIDVMRRVAENPSTYRPTSAKEALRVQMLAYQVDSGRQAITAAAFVERIASFPECASELAQLADILDASAVNVRPVPEIEDVPLLLHGSYSRREILTAVGFLSGVRRAPHQSGLYLMHERKIEIMFVTLDKSAGFHDRIAYHDYAVSPTHFHWQTQNTAGIDSAAGQRYAESKTNGWKFLLFVRETPSQPFRACGPVSIASEDDVTGDRPMSIDWTLAVPLPAALFMSFSVLRGGA